MKGIKRTKKINPSKRNNGNAYAKRQQRPKGWENLTPEQKFVLSVAER